MGDLGGGRENKIEKKRDSTQNPGAVGIQDSAQDGGGREERRRRRRRRIRALARTVGARVKFVEALLSPHQQMVGREVNEKKVGI